MACTSNASNAETSLHAYSIGPTPPRGALRLHLNEYRFKHSPAVVDTLERVAQIDQCFLTDYQSGVGSDLVEGIVKYVGAPSSENVLVTPGSDEALRAVIDTSGLRGFHTVIMGVPGYTHFGHYVKLRGLDLVTYSIGIGTAAGDHEAALRYHSGLLDKGCLVYLCSPNNPTGDLWSSETVNKLAMGYPASLFLIDEAYIEFTAAVEASSTAAEALNQNSLVSVAMARENVVVTRTFSKAFGLAAMRIGYVVGTATTVATLRLAVSPKAFNPMAAAIARAVLNSLPHYYQAVLAARRGMTSVVAKLRGRGWWVYPTPGNFFLVFVADADDITAQLAALGIQVRNRTELPGLSGFVRVTAGSPEDNLSLIAAFATLTIPAGPPPQEMYTNKGKVAAIKTMTRATLAILTAKTVVVWAHAGTLLGMVRHGGMIPTDDDSDLAYYYETVDPLAGLVDAFRRRGLTLQRSRTDAYWQVGTNLPGCTISPYHVDIFSFIIDVEDGTPVYVLGDPRFRVEEPDSSEAHCNTKYYPGELFPLRHDLRFYDMTIPVPAKTEAALSRALGPEYMTTAKARTGGGYVSYRLRDMTPA